MTTSSSGDSLASDLQAVTGLDFTSYHNDALLDAVADAVVLPRLLGRLLLVPAAAFGGLAAATGLVVGVVWGVDAAWMAFAVGAPLAGLHAVFASAVWIRRVAVRDVQRLMALALDRADDVLVDWRLRVLVDGRAIRTIPLVALMRGVFALVVRPVLTGRLRAGGRLTDGLAAWGVHPVYDRAARRVVQVLHREYARYDYLHTVIVDASGTPVDAAYEPWPDATARPPAPVASSVDAARRSLDRVTERATLRFVAPLVRLWSGVGVGATLVALGMALWIA